MSDRLVTVFGGTGFIGRYLIQRLAARGARIRVPARNLAHGKHLQPMGNVGQIVVERADISRDEVLAAAVRGSTMVVNLVGILYEKSRQRFAQVHGELPGRIARLAAESGVERFVQMSALGADPQATSAYARTKAAGEQAARAGFPGTVVMRPSVVIGPEDDFFNRFGEMARFTPVLPLIGGGQTRFQPVYVGDVADALIAALMREDTAGRTYELGGPRVYTFEELLRYLLDVIGRKRFLVAVPYKNANLLARVLEYLPVPPLTRDQLELLKRDNVVSEGALGFADLGITPRPIEIIVPDYLTRYRVAPRQRITAR